VFLAYFCFVICFISLGGDIRSHGHYLAEGL